MNITSDQAQPPQPRPRIGVALSGGFIRATAQIGVLQVLAEHNIPIDMVAGCSSGAVIAATYAAGTAEQLRQRLAEAARREYWQVIFQPTIRRHGLFKTDGSRIFFEEFVGQKTFADLAVTCFVAATDLRSMHEAVISTGSVSQALQAATTIPGLFMPAVVGEKLLVDGGNFNLIPSRVLYDHGADYVIAVDVSQPPNLITRWLANYQQLLERQKLLYRGNISMSRMPNLLQQIWRALVLSGSQIQNFYHHAYRYDALIKPVLARTRRMSFKRVNYCVEQGRQAALAALPKIQADIARLSVVSK